MMWLWLNASNVLYLSTLSLLIYCLYCILSWYHRIVVIGTQVDKLPGDNPHWLYGNIKNVSLLLYFEKDTSTWTLPLPRCYRTSVRVRYFAVR